MSAPPETMTVSRSPGKAVQRCCVPQTQPVPAPGAGQVLVKVQAAGVNRPDVLQRMGLYPAPKGHNELPGLEIAVRLWRRAPGSRGLKSVSGSWRSSTAAVCGILSR